MARIYLGLGSNLGNRPAHLQRAVTGLAEGMEVTAVSSVYETAAWGVTEQPDFLNMCVEAQTELAPRELLRFIKALEVQVGRKPTFRWGPRVIDIDILLYDQQVVEEAGLSIPHQGLAERASVLVPLADIAPDVVHPQLDETVSVLLQAVDTSSVLRQVEPLSRTVARPE